MTQTDRRPQMGDFEQYRRSQIAELRPWQEGDDIWFVSISASDKEAGSPKAGDMIARNPKNHDDQWLVAAQYFADNFEPVPRASTPTEKEVGDSEIAAQACKEHGLGHHAEWFRSGAQINEAPKGDGAWMVAMLAAISRARSASVTGRLDKALANFLAVEVPKTDNFWPLYREVRDAYDEMKRDGSASVTDAFSRGAREGWLRCGVFHVDIDFEAREETQKELDDRWPIVADQPQAHTTTAHGEGELRARVIEECARWYDDHGWEIDPMNVSAEMKRALKSTKHEGEGS